VYGQKVRVRAKSKTVPNGTVSPFARVQNAWLAFQPAENHVRVGRGHTEIRISFRRSGPNLVWLRALVALLVWCASKQVAIRPRPLSRKVVPFPRRLITAYARSALSTCRAFAESEPRVYNPLYLEDSQWKSRLISLR
jgi:hypothetical protein